MKDCCVRILAALLAFLLPLAALATPNLPEAAALAGRPVDIGQNRRLEANGHVFCALFLRAEGGSNGPRLGASAPSEKYAKR